MKIIIFNLIICGAILLSCSSNEKPKTEEISIEEQNLNNDLDSSGKKIYFNPGSIILTGQKNIRLIPIKKQVNIDKTKKRERDFSYESYGYYDNEYREVEGGYRFFYPGIDIIYGYNLVNISHYNSETDSLTNFFEKTVLIRTLYFPSLIQDSLYNKPINRDYFLCSVYDEDTNKDSIINKNDLRRFYYINLNNNQKQLLLPKEYSAARSEYDAPNDYLYIYAMHDENGNGLIEKTEELNIFLVPLSNPIKTKRIY